MPTLDLRAIPPPQRHPLVYQGLDALAPGESLELVNDHRPSPLRYELEGHCCVSAKRTRHVPRRGVRASVRTERVDRLRAARIAHLTSGRYPDGGAWAQCNSVVADTVPTWPSRIREQWREALYPPVDGDVVDLDPAFTQEFFDVAIGEPVPEGPAQGEDDDLGREPKAFER
jgi:Uncharacterized conserved protein (DUF2249)